MSFKTKEESIAKEQRELLMQSLDQKGWLLPKDSLKTELIFSNSKKEFICHEFLLYLSIKLNQLIRTYHYFEDF